MRGLESQLPHLPHHLEQTASFASVCALKMEAMVTASGSDGEGGGGSSLELVST